MDELSFHVYLYIIYAQTLRSIGWLHATTLRNIIHVEDTENSKCIFAPKIMTLIIERGMFKSTCTRCLILSYEELIPLRNLNQIIFIIARALDSLNSRHRRVSIHRLK